ncbi:MAG: cell division protein FtsL [Pseudomonadota bacterium]|nr:cell division protein FtsL [Pseudomonadota bacterium]
MFRSSMLNVLLALALVVSALALVTTQYRARKAFVGLEIARGQADDLVARQRRLEADLARAAQPAMIDKKARKILDMESLPAERTLYLTLRAGEGAARLAELDAARLRAGDGGGR